MNVFLSYATEDQDLADSLRTHLSKAGFEVWDPIAQLLPGDNVGTQIEAALEKSEAMVVLLSPKSQRSPFVNSEIQFALGSSRYKNRLIPVLVQGSIDVPWIEYVDVINAATRSPDQVGRLVVDALKKSPIQASR
jgi:TIR domain